MVEKIEKLQRNIVKICESRVSYKKKVYRENIRTREVMSNMEKCGHSKSDPTDPKLDDNNRNHPANKKDESEFRIVN